MEDIYDLVKNVETIYDSDTSFQILKDFERVLDEVDYMYIKTGRMASCLMGQRLVVIGSLVSLCGLVLRCQIQWVQNA